MIENYLILNPVLAFLVYEDARRRQVKGRVGGYSPLLWGLLTLIGSVLGLVFYLLARRQPGHEIRF
jgi:hypothetical protein